jgi:hypothetical protein
MNALDEVVHLGMNTVISEVLVSSIGMMNTIFEVASPFGMMNSLNEVGSFGDEIPWMR